MRVVLAFVSLALVSGCGRSCKNDHPYVPYSIGDGAPADAGTDSAVAGGLQEDASVPEAIAVAAPPGAVRWTLDGLELVAPPERVFVLGLARDLDGDGTKDALAVVRAKADTIGGELLYFHGKGAILEPPVVVASSRDALAPADPACTPGDRLAQVGRRSAAVELGVQCVEPLPGARWLAVVTFDPNPRAHFVATLADPPGAPKLFVDVDGTDRDGDGIDDVSLRVTIDAPNAPFEPMPRVTGKLAWFDRPAGLSRAPDEPDASLHAIAQAALARAARAKDAPSVPASAHQIRALYKAMCSEGGATRITRVSASNGPVVCGPSRALEESGVALARAFAVLGDPVRAAWALDAAELPPATRTAARVAEAQSWIAQAAPVAIARQLRAIAAVPAAERGTSPAWGPLAFEPSGKLLVRTTAGLARVDPQMGDETDAPDASPWKTQVTSPEGATRWVAAFAPCDDFAIHATFAGAVDADAPDVLLPIAPPVGMRCTQGKSEPARAFALAWGTRGLEAIVAGEPILFAPDLARATIAASSLDQPWQPGSPRSPNGKALVIPTSQGIFQRANGKMRLLRAKELDGGYMELQGCTVSDDATAVACVRGGRAFVGTWEGP